jgi:hypothetical protein
LYSDGYSRPLSGRDSPSERSFGWVVILSPLRYKVSVRRFHAALLTLVVLLVLAGSAAGSRHAHSANISYSFQGYANNVKVLPPLVGRWQLAVVHIHGSGNVGSNAYFQSRIQPHTESIPAAAITARITGYSYYQAAHDTYRKLEFTVQVTFSREPRGCAVGATGKLTIYDTDSRISNGERGDYIILGDWGGRCPAFTEGFSNLDGGARTKPSHGGPPDGGQWAVVHINAA